MRISCNMCPKTAFHFYEDKVYIGKMRVPIYFARCLKHQITEHAPCTTLAQKEYEERMNELSVKDIMEC